MAGWVFAVAAAQIVLALVGVSAAITGRVAADAAVCLPVILLGMAILGYDVARGDWQGAAAAAFTIVVWWWVWRRNRRGRDGVARLAGYKARAARDRLAARQREAEVPR